jgi:drug/metabolite transporter (DMT)-like permease
MAASGTYQLLLLHQLLQAPVLTLPLMLKTPREFLNALHKRMIKHVLRMLANGFQWFLFYLPIHSTPVLISQSILKTKRELIFALQLQLKMLASKMDANGILHQLSSL